MMNELATVLLRQMNTAVQRYLGPQLPSDWRSQGQILPQNRAS
jgi:hypothetical protein